MIGIRTNISKISKTQYSLIEDYIYKNNLYNLNKLNSLNKKISDIFIKVDNFNDAVLLNTYANLLLWKSEDKIRELIDKPHNIAMLKIIIDYSNQIRNESINIMDFYIHREFNFSKNIELMETETPGMIIDRLSIINLKLFHLEIYLVRLGSNFFSEYRQRKKILKQQKGDLLKKYLFLNRLFKLGLVGFRIYSPQKFYNDKKFIKRK